jgi:hypothetical protein
MTQPTYAQWRATQLAANSLAIETLDERILSALATIASGQNPDGTTFTLAGGGTALTKNRVTYTGGNITAPNNSAWTTLGAGDITIPATAGLWVLGMFKMSCASLVGFRSMDIHTKPAGVLTNQFSTGTATSNSATDGMKGSEVSAGNVAFWVASMMYQIVAGDISGGNVVFSLTTWGASSDVIRGTALLPIDFAITTLGS